MNYEQVLEFMFNSLPMYQRIGQAAYKATLDNTIAFDEYFKHPHKSFKTIHIAGTNGKGSTSHSIASILQEAGYKTGLYTSPHLIDYRERIRVNGTMISKEFVCSFINDNLNFIENLKPSFFEMSVALAFEYFKYNKVDVAVIEVGMGGRLDSTNIIQPDLSVITNISLDHTQFLGDSLTKIAIEKAGIIKQNTTVIIGETQKETSKVFAEIATNNNSPIYFADNEFKTELIGNKDNKGIFSVIHKDLKFDIEFDLLGTYQEKNLATILESINQLQEKNYKISEDNIRIGLSKVKDNTGLRGRWEIIQKIPLVVCDTGHNKAGLKYVINQIISQQYENLHIVIGFVNDKNVGDVLKLFPQKAIYYFTRSSVPRSMSSEEVQIEAKKVGLTGNIYVNVESAYNNALEKTGNNDMIFVGGSTFIVADLLTTIYKTDN